MHSIEYHKAKNDLKSLGLWWPYDKMPQNIKYIKHSTNDETTTGCVNLAKQDKENKAWQYEKQSKIINACRNWSPQVSDCGYEWERVCVCAAEGLNRQAYLPEDK